MPNFAARTGQSVALLWTAAALVAAVTSDSSKKCPMCSPDIKQEQTFPLEQRCDSSLSSIVILVLMSLLMVMPNGDAQW